MRHTFALILLLTAVGAGAEHHTLQDKIMAAMASDARSEADVARDKNRKPVETLTFFQMRDDMSVMELIPGGGWYTRILAPVLRENGKFYVAIGTGRVRDGLATEDGFDHINVIDPGVEAVRDGEFGTRNIAELSFGVTGLDLVLTFRNMHNYTAAGRANVNAAVFDAIKPGGHYGVVDHNRRHMEPSTAENRRRVDVVQIILETQAAGFELVDASDLHYRPDDELRYEVGRKTVTGNTDRFTLLFRRP